MTNTDERTINEFFDHKIDQIYPSEDNLRSELLSGRRLKFYIGADATGPRLHIGHLLPVLKLKKLQELGHEIIFLVGDFTARLGDPTDKSEVRKVISEEEILKNASEFQAQIAKYIDFEGGENPASIVFNSEWNSKLNLEDVINLASNTTVQQMIERDMFQDRLNSNKPIYLHEFLYPLIQGYDSVHMEVDGEFGGKDQTFNMLMGRTLLKNMKDKEKFVITTHFLLSSDGKTKMSKSIGNCIFINDSPEDKYAKVMSIPDDLIVHYYKFATFKSLEEIEDTEKNLEAGEDPMQIKKSLAHEIVTIHDGEEKAKKAQEFFEKTVQNNEIPENATEINKSDLETGDVSLKDLLNKTGLVSSNAEIKRLIRAGAVEINGEIHNDLNYIINTQDLESARIGKKTWVKFVN